MKSIKKCFEILFLFNSLRPKMDVEEISRSVGIPKSSVYRYLKTLVGIGMLEHNPITRKYGLGLKALELGVSVYNQMELRRFARPFLRNLADETGETVYLIGLSSYKAICIDSIESTLAVRMSITVGETFPLYSCATGQALMAYLPAKLQDSIIEKGLQKFTEKTITDPHELKKKLEDIVKQGFAYSNGEFDEGARAVSAPIFDALSRVVAGLSVAGPLHRFTSEKIQEYKELVIENARGISKKLVKRG
jgi:DNA-binding IclR family transcriptional regulator